MTIRIQKILDGGPEAINARLAELSREWSVGRVMKGVVGAVIAVGLVLAAFVHVGWLALAAFGALCLMQYLFDRRSIVGDLIRGLGFRSGVEIEQERLALKTFRGDFKLLPTIHEVEDRDAVSRMVDEGGIPLDDEPKVDAREAVQEVLEAARR
ncbi:MAG: hypothetical protein U0736_23400 [Gemmataceae bacterium]